MKAMFPPLRLALRHLLSFAAAALLLPAGAQASAAPNTLNAVSLTQGNNDSQVIKLVFKNPVEELPIAFTTSNPHRLVLDFPATTSTLPRNSASPEGGVIKNWQVVQAGERTRVVLNLNAPTTYELRKDRNLVLAVIHGIAVQPGTPVPARFAETGPVSKHGIRDIDFRRGKDGESRILVSLSDPGVGVDIKKQGSAIQVDFLNTSLPSPLRRRLDVTDFATPAQTVETFEEGKHTRMLITPKGKWDYSAWQAGNQFTLEVRSLEGPQAIQEGKPQYSGEKLSLNFQNVEVRSVLQVIADFTGLNIITSDTVTGNVTLRLKDVPWDQALDIILRAKGLDKRTTGNVIWVAPRDELNAKEKVEMEARQQIADLEDLSTEFIRLNYLRANEAQAIINGQSVNAAQASEQATCSAQATGIGTTPTQATAATSANAGQRILSKRGTSSYELKTNTLFVQDTPSKIKEIKTILASVDVPSKQVMIEARVVVASESFERALGARLGYGGSGKVGNTGIGLGSYNGNSTSSVTNATTGLTTAAPASNVNLGLTDLGMTPTGTFGISVYNAGAAALLSLEIQAMEVDGRGKIVSSPRVVTQNQKPAVILQGTQIPFVTPGSANSAASVTFKDAFLCLLVNPQVLNNDSIILDVEVQKDAQGAVTNGQTAIDTKRVKTQVRVKNGETAVLGGIFEQTLSNSTNKVPFLGDIPILGNLFKENDKVDDKTELLIFLTPRILPDEGALVR